MPDLSAELQAIDSSFAMVCLALDGSIVRVNSNFLRLYGYKARDLVGEPIEKLIPSEAFQRFYGKDVSEALARAESRTVECRSLRQNGSDMWIKAIHTPVFDEEGQPSEIVVFVSDITAEKLRAEDERGQIIAMDASHAIIHFALDGTITHANEIFLRTMGYELHELVGRHHRVFVDPVYAQSAAYSSFWADLAAGRHHAAEFKRLRKDGSLIWLSATYNPIADLGGRLSKIVKYATDVTADKLLQADHEGQIAAIHKSQGVITFDMNGTVLEANARFLDMTGYDLGEVEGRHHRMFVDPSYSHGPEYATFWSELSEGRHQAGEYKRLGKNGREVWLQATYNPVFDLSGRPCKVVKYATDVTREKLRQADHQGQIASIHKAQCVISFNMDGTIIDANDNFLAATGYRLAQVRGQHHKMFVDSQDAQSEDYADFWSALRRGRHQAGDYKRICKDGREIWLHASYNPIFDMSGRPFKIVKYASDVTHERLQRANYEGQVAAVWKSQCVVAFDMDGAIIEANDNFLTAMGYRLDDILGRHHRMFLEPGVADTAEYATFWDTLRAGAFLSAKFKRIGAGGREVWIQASYNPILDLNGRPFKVVKIATDITADVALAADLTDARQRAHHDAATRLPNRARLAEFMSAALEKPGARLAILYMDLDHFKPVNDTFGHEAGDHVLRVTADRLRDAAREDDLVARVGGDEFVVAAPDLSDDEIEQLCQKLIAAVKAPITHEKGTLTVGLSIGVSVSPRDATTADDMMRYADVALYRAKGNGRGSYSFFAAEVNQRLLANRHLADELRHGIKAGQFFLEYQPRFNARTKELHSLEARVGWNHPERGRLDPSEFISVAERSALVVPLGEWMLRAACQAAVAWPGIGLSVGISAVQFLGSDVAAVVGAVLRETGLAPDRLEIQVTETSLLGGVEPARARLAALKASGIRLALSEFAPDHFSLADIRVFPFDAVGIDRRMLADLEAQEDERAVVQAIAKFGRSIGATLTGRSADPDDVLQIRLTARREVEGLLPSRPVSEEAVTAIVTGAPPARLIAAE